MQFSGPGGSRPMVMPNSRILLRFIPASGVACACTLLIGLVSRVGKGAVCSLDTITEWVKAPCPRAQKREPTAWARRAYGQSRLKQSWSGAPLPTLRASVRRRMPPLPENPLELIERGRGAFLTDQRGNARDARFGGVKILGGNFIHHEFLRQPLRQLRNLLLGLMDMVAIQDARLRQHSGQPVHAALELVAFLPVAKAVEERCE